MNQILKRENENEIFLKHGKKDGNSSHILLGNGRFNHIVGLNLYKN